MSTDFWLQAWQEGRTGWHRDEVHPDLPRWEARFLSGGPHRVLVPLCGRSRDLAWLASRGHAVVGVEVAEVAVRGLLADAGLTAVAAHAGAFVRHDAEGAAISVFQGDWFATSPELLGTFDRAWDRAALVAMQPDRREDYVARLRALLAPGARVLLNTFEYDPSEMTGPPFTTPEAAVRRLFGDFDVELLDRRDSTAEVTRLGLTSIFTSTWLLRGPASV